MNDSDNSIQAVREDFEGALGALRLVIATALSATQPMRDGVLGINPDHMADMLLKSQLTDRQIEAAQAELHALQQAVRRASAHAEDRLPRR